MPSYPLSVQAGTSRPPAPPERLQMLPHTRPCSLLERRHRLRPRRLALGSPAPGRQVQADRPWPHQRADHGRPPGSPRTIALHHCVIGRRRGLRPMPWGLADATLRIFQHHRRPSCRRDRAPPRPPPRFRRHQTPHAPSPIGYDRHGSPAAPIRAPLGHPQRVDCASASSGVARASSAASPSSSAAPAAGCRSAPEISRRKLGAEETPGSPRSRRCRHRPCCSRARCPSARHVAAASSSPPAPPDDCGAAARTAACPHCSAPLGHFARTHRPRRRP